MDYGIFVLTEYQLLNAIKLVYFDNSCLKGNCDLFITDSINDIDHKIEILSRISIFNRIIKVKEMSFSKNPFIRKLNSLKHTIIKKSFSNYLYEQYKVNYKTLLVPCSTLLCEMFRHYYNHNSLWYYEDGLGSYFGNIKSTSLTRTHRLANKVLGLDEDVDAMYLNLPLFSNSITAHSLLQIKGEMDEEYIEFLQDVFSKQEFYSAYRDCSYIYLRQPLHLFGDGFEVLDRNLIKTINKSVGKKLIVREHPQNILMGRAIEDETVNIDEKMNMWEIECLNVKEKCMLIGMFSTAQITPKILFDYEPTTVFLFNLFPLDEKLKKEELETVKRFMSIYRDKSKIFIPRTIYELKDFIDCYENR